jgi:serine/threonine protein kinase
MSNPNVDVSKYCLNCLEIKTTPVCQSCGVDDSTLPDVANSLPLRSILNNRYLIGRILGAGGFGITYLGIDLNLGMKVAMKEYMPSGLASRRIGQTEMNVLTVGTNDDYETGLAKFLEEGQMLAKFSDHPGIVSIRDFFRENNTAYIAMSYLEGITLKEYVRQKGGRIPLEQALEIFTPVFDSLHAVHETGILHRDISPDNIYITRERQVKLLDFGAARHSIGEATKSLSVILKPGYAPEEQYRTKGKQGPWTDVYALAACIYHCVGGQLPPDALDRFEEDSLKPLSALVPGIPAHIDAAVNKGLAQRSRDRFQSIREFQYALANQEQVAPVAPVASPAQPEAPYPSATPAHQAPTQAFQAPPQQAPMYPPQQAAYQPPPGYQPPPPPVRPPGSSNGAVKWLIGGGIAVALIAIILVVSFVIGSDPGDGDIGGDEEVVDTTPVDGEVGSDTPETPAANPVPLSNQVLDIGDYVQFGTYNGAPIRWRIVHFEDDGSPMLFSERILSFKSLTGFNSSNDTNDNDFYYSNLREWLNSSANAVSYTQSPPSAENVANSMNEYDSEPGFLSPQNFTNQERSLIKPNKHKILLAQADSGRMQGGSELHYYSSEDGSTQDLGTALQNYEKAIYHNVTELVFPLSIKQLHLYVYKNSAKLGDFVNAAPTPEAVANSEFNSATTDGQNLPLSSESSWWYWLSSPVADSMTDMRVVSYNGLVGNHSADDSLPGVRPALYLSRGQAQIYDNGDGSFEQPYTVVR